MNLEQALPVELTGSHHGRLSRYRTWPVYSRRWVLGRQRVWTGMVAIALLGATIPLLAAPAAARPYGGLAQFALQFLLPTLVGPWLCHAVRWRGLSPLRESIALLMVMTALAAAMLGFHAYAAEPMKQWIAERTGQVDESGQRKRMLMKIGVFVGTQDGPQGGADAIDDAKGDAPDNASLGNILGSITTSFFLGGGVGIWGLRRERAGLAALARERELAQAQAQRREAELRLSVLAAQVEPHFLFNTLAGVRSAIATDPPRASEMIDRLVDYLRAAIPRLRSDGGAQATLGGQVDIVRAYLGLMAARMPRLQFDIDVPVELMAAPFPPLMLISLAENAVKHGAEPKIGPVRVTVQARRTAEGALEVTVADDGAGFGASASGSGLGLTNIRERLQQMHPGRAALTLRGRPEGGVAATLSVPME